MAAAVRPMCTSMARCACVWGMCYRDRNVPTTIFLVVFGLPTSHWVDGKEVGDGFMVVWFNSLSVVMGAGNLNNKDEFIITTAGNLNNKDKFIFSKQNE